MLEDCSDLLECEVRLRREVANIHLLGEIALSQQDVAHLTTLIRQKLSVSATGGTRFLRRQAPASFACFLVQMGICGYQEGDYWSAVQQALGMEADANRQRQWGQAFLRFLGAHHLPRFDLEGGLTYVTPILMHGGIPDSCLGEFFEKIVLPMVYRDLMDPTDPDEIVQELIFRREDNDARIDAERRRAALQSEARSLRKDIEFWRQAVAAYDQVVDLWQLEEQAALFDQLPDLPADFTAFRDRQDKEIDQLESKIRALQERQTYQQQVISALTEQDRRALAQAREIERCISASPQTREQLGAIEALKEKEAGLAAQLSTRSGSVFSEPWQDRYGESLLRLPFEELKERITQFEAIVIRQAEAEQALEHIDTLIRGHSSSRSNSLPVLTGIAGALTVIGTLVTSSWLVAIIGFILTLTTGLRSRSWHRQVAATRIQKEAWEEIVSNTTGHGRTLHQRIVEILGELPIAQEPGVSPSLELLGSLVSLTAVYRELDEVRNHRQATWEEVRPQLQLVQRLITSLNVQPTSNLENIIQAMDQMLKDAERRKTGAMDATQELEHSIKPESAKLNNRKQALLAQAVEVENRLAALGEGDVEAGIERLAQQRQVIDEARQRRSTVSQQYSHFGAIERQVRSSVRAGTDKDALSHKVRHLETRRQDLRAQIGQINEEIASYPAVFPGVDEPIRRFLLYGDAPAEEMLVQSAILLHQYRTEGEVSDFADLGLPERVVTVFERWWSEYSSREPRVTGDVNEPDTVGEQRLRSPRILLDPVAAEVTAYLPVQRYQAASGTANVCLEIVGSAPGARQQTRPLRVYQGPRSLVETEECNLPLLFPEELYKFALKNDMRTIRQWEVVGMRKDEPYLAFDWRSGKLITETPLKKSRIWLLIHRDSTIEPANAVLVEQMPLFGHWRDFGFYDLDLGQTDELYVSDSQGRRFSIPVSSEAIPGLCLEGGQPLEGVDSEGAAVYVGPPPHIVVPIQNEAELRNWRLTLASEVDSELQEVRHYRLGDRGSAFEVSADGSRVCVSLVDDMLLGQRPVGRFVIRLRKPPYTDWLTTICTVPDLQIKFDKALYLPTDAGKTERIRATVAVSEDLEFAPWTPAELLERQENLYTVRIDRSEDALRGSLCGADEPDVRTPITATIPKVQWRLQGLDEVHPDVWYDTVEEVWLGDWETTQELHLVVALPALLEGSLKLGLDSDSLREEKKELRVGKARFDLLAFGEALRAGPSIQTFIVTLPNSPFGIKDTPLLKVRTRWEVGELQCIQEPRGHTRNILTVTWTEWGKTGGKQRFIRLWSTKDTRLPPVIQQKIPEGEQSVKLEADVAKVPPGKYRLQVCLYDPWSTPQPLPPVPNARNTLEIEIFPIEDIRQGELVSLCSIVDDRNRVCELERGAYKIRIIGKIINRRLPTRFTTRRVLVTRANEGWYVGDLEIPPGSGLETEISESNPVKFEYNASRDEITAVEDRDGDGAMYCCQCRKLYWSQATDIEEREKGHRVIGPIEVFGVRWT